MYSDLNVVVVKPSKYDIDGYVDRYWRGFMPNATLPFIRSMIPDVVGDTRVSVSVVDEYVHTDLGYLDLLDARRNGPTLVLLVGTQSHQFHRALDLAAYAKDRDSMVVIGGPHPMTCDTTMLQGKGISFSMSEAEVVLPAILEDAVVRCWLQPVYGENQRWATELNSPVLIPPSKEDQGRCVTSMLGIYPYRGCPFTCNFCSVIKIASRRVRGQTIETTIRSMRAARRAGIKSIMFTCDNFNKIPNVVELLETIMREGVQMPFFCQCDTQISEQPELVELMARAGCFDIFVGAESFNRKTLLAAHKAQNKPEKYEKIVKLCKQFGITSHFSNIIGFPEDTEDSILEHLRVLKELDPGMASFYVLCPIPGTEQYDDFMARGLISEYNLDRFDTIYPVWNHPNLSKEDRTRLLHQCYREFYSTGHALRKLRYIQRRPNSTFVSEVFGSLAYEAFSRWCTFNERHPMSGGVGRVRRDNASDYMALRRKTYGYSHAPLPTSLQLSESDQRINKVGIPLTLV